MLSCRCWVWVRSQKLNWGQTQVRRSDTGQTQVRRGVGLTWGWESDMELGSDMRLGADMGLGVRHWVRGQTQRRGLDIRGQI